MLKSFNIRVMLVLWQGKIKATESRINDGRREVFDKGGETMGMKD